jgi:putative membrane protein
VTLAALSPPLEHLATELVSVHMIQHVMLILVSAPLLAVSHPVAHLMRALPPRVRKPLGRWRRQARLTPATSGRLARPAIVWLLYAGVIWFWHGSVPYQLAAGNQAIHVIEHLTFLAVALGFWAIVLAPVRQITPGYRILMVFTTAFHTVLLSALITFANEPWYSTYLETAAGHGIDPLSDQQLAGLLMWIPGGLLYTGVGLWLLTAWIRSQDPAMNEILVTKR